MVQKFFISDLIATEDKQEGIDRVLSISYSKDSCPMKLLNHLKKMNNHFGGFIIILEQVETPNHFSISNLLNQAVSEPDKKVKFSNVSEDGLCVLGFQRHLISKEEVSTLKKRACLSLGELRGEINLAEPILRDTELVVFDPSVMRAGDIGYLGSSIPSGLLCEEACQLCKYVGTSSSFKRIEFTFPEDFNTSDKWVPLYGEMIWYFLEGFYINSNDHPLSSSFQSYFIIGDDHDFEFVQSEISGRWWVKHEGGYIACTEDEYQSAANGKVSNRLTAMLS